MPRHTFKKGGRKLTKRQKKEVKTLISKDIELRYLPFNVNMSSLTTATPQLFRVSAIPQIISGVDTRNGQEIELKKVTFSYNVANGGGSLFLAPDSYTTVRLVLFRWYGDDAAGVDPPTFAQLFSVNGTTYPNQFQYNQDYKQKYHIIYDRNHTVGSAASYNGSSVAQYNGYMSSYSSNVHHIRGKKLGRKTIKYDPGSAVITGTGNVWAIAMSDSSVAPNPDILIAFQVFYTDA